MTVDSVNSLDMTVEAAKEQFAQDFRAMIAKAQKEGPGNRQTIQQCIERAVADVKQRANEIKVSKDTNKNWKSTTNDTQLKHNEHNAQTNQSDALRKRIVQKKENPSGSSIATDADSSTNKKELSQAKSAKMKCSIKRCICWSVLIFLGICVIVLVAVYNSKTLQETVHNTSMRNMHHVMKWLRVASISMLNICGIDQIKVWQLHTTNCPIENVNMENETQFSLPPCVICQPVRRVAAPDFMDKEKYEQHSFAIPLLTKRNRTWTPLAWDDLRAIYLQQKNQSQMGINWLESPHTDIANVTVFMERYSEEFLLNSDIWEQTNEGGSMGYESEKEMTSEFNAVWHMRRPGPLSLLRKYYPQPSFFSRRVEISTYSSLHIWVQRHHSSSGQGGETGTLQSEGVDMLCPNPRKKHNCLNPRGKYLYFQSYGTRYVTFTPVERCEECREFGVVMTPGDSLIFDPVMWSVNTRPLTTQELESAISRTIENIKKGDKGNNLENKNGVAGIQSHANTKFNETPKEETFVTKERERDEQALIEYREKIVKALRSPISFGLLRSIRF